MAVNAAQLLKIIAAATFTGAKLWAQTIGNELASLDGRASVSEAEHTIRWDDIRIPSTAINPPGQVSDPDIDTDDGLYIFDATGVEILFLTAQMPHGKVIGSNLHPHLHWTKTTSASGDVGWEFEYQLAGVNGVFPGSWASLGIISDVHAGSGAIDTDTADQHLVTEWGVIDMSAITTVSSMIKIKISRVGSDASDTYAADAKLLEVDLHYQIDARGTTGEYSGK